MEIFSSEHDILRVKKKELTVLSLPVREKETFTQKKKKRPQSYALTQLYASTQYTHIIAPFKLRIVGNKIYFITHS